MALALEASGTLKETGIVLLGTPWTVSHQEGLKPVKYSIGQDKNQVMVNTLTRGRRTKTTVFRI